MSRIAGTAVTGFGWFAFLLLFLAFFAHNFTFWQNIAIILVSCSIVGAIIAVLWLTMLGSRRK
jgi:hypothetical protein